MLSLIAISNTAMASIVIDGYVKDDWHIDLSQASTKGYLNTHHPSGGLDIDVVHEDNADATRGWQTVGPAQSWHNLFDAEAMYFDNDYSYGYIAVITGMPQGGLNPPGNSLPPEGDLHIFKPGDIAMYIDGRQYGINVNDGHLYQVNKWKNAVYTWNTTEKYNPWIIDMSDPGNIDLGAIPFAYSDEQNTHYVIEARIPLHTIGAQVDWDDPAKWLKVHWGMECGNDVLNLRADVNPTPEPASMALVGLGVAGFLARRKRRV